MAALFDFGETSAIDRLQVYEKKSVTFLNVAQTAKVLGYTDFEVRYAISCYRLDALVVVGEYRIATPFIRRYLKHKDDLDLRSYYQIAEGQALDGIYALVFDGYPQPLLAALKRTGTPIEAIDELMHKTQLKQYDKMPAEEPNPIDWYALADLPSSGQSMTVSSLAAWLRVSAKQLSWDLHIPIDTLLDWPEIVDLLTEREVVNLPCPYTVKRPQEPKTDAQLEFLFSD